MLMLVVVQWKLTGEYVALKYKIYPDVPLDFHSHLFYLATCQITYVLSILQPGTHQTDI